MSNIIVEWILDNIQHHQDQQSETHPSLGPTVRCGIIERSSKVGIPAYGNNFAGMIYAQSFTEHIVSHVRDDSLAHQLRY